MSKKKVEDAWTTADLVEALEKRYAGNGYAVVHEVRNATGVVAQERYADCLVMSLWPSRGLKLSGFELKASRSDWLRELKKPEKADAIGSFCDFWWVVAGSRDIVADGELPHSWGLMVPDAKGLVITTPASQNEHVKSPTRGFLASLFRAAANIDVKSQSASRQAGFNEGLKQSSWEHKRLKEAVEKFEAASGVKIGEEWNAGRLGEAVREVVDGNILSLKKRVAEFEASSGVRIDEWNSGDVGEAVRAVLGANSTGVQGALKALRRDLGRTLDSIDEFLNPKPKICKRCLPTGIMCDKPAPCPHHGMEFAEVAL